MKQYGFIGRVINYVVLDNGMYKVKYTSARYVHLFNNEDYVSASGVLTKAAS